MLFNRTIASLYRLQLRNFALKFNKISDKPIAFSETKAANLKAKYINVKQMNEVPESRQWSLIGSLALFFIYFFILREENDIDELLGRDPDETYKYMVSKGYFADGSPFVNKEGYRLFKR